MGMRQKPVRGPTGGQPALPLRWRHLVTAPKMEPSHVETPASASFALLLAACSLTQYSVSEGEINQYLKERARLRETAGDPRHHVEQDPTR